ncbi:MAG: enoyl-CoA hydratase/isomerase family protein [Dehalococcoidia bacterium]
MPLTSLSIEDYVATLTLYPAPEGVSRSFVEALASSCDEIGGARGRAYAVVVRCVPEFPARWSNEALAEPLMNGARPLGAAFDALAALPQPTVAAVRGSAHSAGLELALACDMRVAASGATFAAPETALGLMPLGGATQRLPRAVGRSQALRLLLSGLEIDAVEAKRIGLLVDVVSEGEEVDSALRLARSIAARAPIATRFVKEAVWRGLEQPLQQGLRTELDLTVILQTTADRAEGVRAFVEGRAPRFTGA